MELPITKLRPPSNSTRQELFGQYPEWIVEALNGALKPDGELEKILIDLQKLQQIVQALHESPSRPIRTGTDSDPYWGWPLAKFDDPKTEALNRDGSAIAHRLNRKLRRMRQHVMVVNFQYKKLETIVLPVCKKNRERLLALCTERIIFICDWANSGGYASANRAKSGFLLRHNTKSFVLPPVVCSMCPTVTSSAINARAICVMYTDRERKNATVGQRNSEGDQNEHL